MKTLRFPFVAALPVLASALCVGATNADSRISAVPVSRDEKIEVKLLMPAERDLGTKVAPKEISREEDGKLVWRLNLKPGEKRELPLKFSVEYPGGTPVTGVD